MNYPSTKWAGNLKLNLASGALALFFLSFLMSGNASAIPQVFLAQLYPARKTFLLSVCLFSATLVAVAGVLISRRITPKPASLSTGLVITTLMAVELLSTKSYAVFLCSLLVVQFADNFLLNQIDLAGVARAATLRPFNDTAGMTARLLGMLAAPVFFTAFALNHVVEQFVVGLIGVVAITGCLRLFRVTALNVQKDGRLELFNAPDQVDFLVFSYAISIYAALYLLAANLIYMLRDLFQFQQSATRGGIATLVVFLFALIANSTRSAVGDHAPGPIGRTSRLGSLGAPAILLVLISGFLLLGIRTSYPAVLIGCGLLGLAYGLFLWEVRDYSSTAAREGKLVLLSWFNNMSNISSLLAFGLMLAMAAQRVNSPASYYVRLLWTIAMLPAVGLAVLGVATVISKRKLQVAHFALPGVK